MSRRKSSMEMKARLSDFDHHLQPDPRLSRHTPGPWKVDGHCVVNERGACIADCSDDDMNKPEERAVADAKLIVAMFKIYDAAKQQ